MGTPVSHTIPCFLVKRYVNIAMATPVTGAYVNIAMGTPVTGASNARVYEKSRFSTNISLYLGSGTR